jgi:hypothetical protein
VPGQSEPGCQVDRRRRLTDAALLVDDCDRLRYVVTQSLWIWRALTTARNDTTRPSDVFHDSHPGEMFHDSRPIKDGDRPQNAAFHPGSLPEP